MSIVKGCLYGTYIRKKLNVESFTEKELIKVNDVMPPKMWTS